MPLPTMSPTLTPDDLGQATPGSAMTPTPVIAPESSGLPPGLYTESDEVGQLILALSPIAVVVLIIVVLRSGLFRRRR